MSADLFESLQAQDSKSITKDRIQMMGDMTYATFETCCVSNQLTPRLFCRIRFGALYQSRSTSAVERLRCKLSYFYQITFVPEYVASFAPLTSSTGTAATPLVEGTVTFSRHTLAVTGQNPALQTASGLPEWEKMTGRPALPQPFSDHIQLHTNSMEEPSGATTVPSSSQDAAASKPSVGVKSSLHPPVFVNFANQYLHIGEIIPSLTQEEVLFSAAPEHFPG